MTDSLVAPTLPGVASSRSLALGSKGVSLVLSCDVEGGVCTGDVDATIRVRERLVPRRRYTRRMLYARTRTVRLTSVGFAIAPGYSTTVHAPMSSQNWALLTQLGNGPLDVELSGRGFSSHVVTLEAARRRT